MLKNKVPINIILKKKNRYIRLPDGEEPAGELSRCKRLADLPINGQKTIMKMKP